MQPQITVLLLLIGVGAQTDLPLVDQCKELLGNPFDGDAVDDSCKVLCEYYTTIGQRFCPQTDVYALVDCIHDIHNHQCYRLDGVTRSTHDTTEWVQICQDLFENYPPRLIKFKEFCQKKCKIYGNEGYWDCPKHLESAKDLVDCIDEYFPTNCGYHLPFPTDEPITTEEATVRPEEPSTTTRVETIDVKSNAVDLDGKGEPDVVTAAHMSRASHYIFSAATFGTAIPPPTRHPHPGHFVTAATLGAAVPRPSQHPNVINDGEIFTAATLGTAVPPPAAAGRRPDHIHEGEIFTGATLFTAERPSRGGRRVNIDSVKEPEMLYEVAAGAELQAQPEAERKIFRE